MLKRRFGLWLKLGMLRKLQGLDDAPGKAPAFKDLVLSLIIVHVHGIDGKDLFEIDNLRVLLVDLDGYRSPVDGLHRKCSHCGGDQYDQKKGDDDPSPLLDHFPVVPKVDLFFFLRGGVGIPGWGGELVISFRRDLFDIIHAILFILEGPEGGSKTYHSSNAIPKFY